MSKKKKIDEIEKIGKTLPKSEKTEEFIKKVQAKAETQKEKSKDKSKKAKSKTKKGKAKAEATPLTDLPGVGNALAKRIIDHGFKTADEIAELETEDLTDIKGIGSPQKAESLIEAARKMLGTKPKKKPKKEPEPPKIKKAPPLKVRVAIPEGETVFFKPSEIDNTQHQPRGFLDDGELYLPNDFITNIRRHRGNFQAILAVKVTHPGEIARGLKVITIDGHRRVAAIQKINYALDAKDQLTVKTEILDVTEPEAAVIALDINLDAMRLSESERDKWIYSLMDVHAMTDEQIAKTTGLSKVSLSNIRRVFEKAPAQILELLDKGEVSTGHIKTVVSLPERDQKRIIKKAAKKDLSVREVESEAKQARSKESVISILYDHVFTKYEKQIAEKTELEVPSLANLYTKITNAVFPSGAESSMTKFGHWVSDSDVKSAIRRAGLKVIEKVEDLPPPKPKSLCESCVAYVKHGKKCLWTATVPEAKPPKFDACPKYLAGRAYSEWELSVCPHCNNPAVRASGQAPYYHTVEGVVTVSGDDLHRFRDPAVKGDITMKAHTWCLFQYLVKQLDITGACEDCSNSDCAIMQGLSKMTEIVKGSFNVTKCKMQKPLFNLEAFNNETVEVWADAMKAQEPDPEPEEESKEETPEILAETVDEKTKEKGSPKKTA